MTIILSMLLSATSLFACPEITGTFTCTSTRGETDTVYMQTTNGIEYSILNENDVKPIELIADNEIRTSKEFITDDYGKVIGVIVKNTKAHCPEQNLLKFEIDANTEFAGVKKNQLLKATAHKISDERFETTTTIITTDRYGKETTTSESVCTM